MVKPVQPKVPLVVERPPPVPMPPPIGAPPVEPLVRAILPSTRAPASAAGGTGGAPGLRASAQAFVVPAGVEVTALALGADATWWYALAHRGLMAVRGVERRRYASLSLVPRDEATRLTLDSLGRPLLAVGRAYILRWSEGAWRRVRVGNDPKAQVLAAAAGPKGRLWALVLPASKPAAARPAQSVPATDAKPPPSRHDLRVLRTTGPQSDEFFEVAQLPMLGLDGPPRFGRMLIEPGGEVYVPLFTLDDGAVPRAAGLAHLRAGLTAIDVWRARFGFEESDGSGPPLLPDAWVNAVTRAPDGTIYVATNSGLVQVRPGKVRVFDENAFIDSEVILDVAIDPQGRVWAGTLEGLGYIESDEWKSVRHPGLERKVAPITAEFGGRLWVGTESGVWRGEGAGFDRVQVGEERRIGDVRDIAVDRDGGVWVLTSQGVFSRKR